MNSFGDKLRRAREVKGYSQTEVFKRTKINNKTLSRYEKGGSEPDYETLKILTALYEVNVEDLIGSGEKTPSIEETKLDIKTKKLLSNVEELKNDPSNIDFLIEMSNKMLGK